MTSLTEVVERSLPATPWTESDNIPWNEPAFSRRMLDVHLDQAHDLASRRFEVVDRHLAWIHQALLGERPTRILDLTCGPGLYTSRLARLGHRCVGVDSSLPRSGTPPRRLDATDWPARTWSGTFARSDETIWATDTGW